MRKKPRCIPTYFFFNRSRVASITLDFCGVENEAEVSRPPVKSPAKHYTRRRRFNTSPARGVRMYMPKQDRHFCFTINNWTEEELNQLKKIELKKIKYLIVGDEIAPTTGTPHLQCFITWANVKTESACKKRLPKRAYVRFMYDHSNPTACAEYCKKQKVLHEAGSFPRQGQRNDLVNVVKEVKEGKKIRTMIDDGTVKNYQGLKYAQDLQKYYEVRRNWKPIVKWYWGATGTGKTKTAYEEYSKKTEDDNIYFSMDTGRWWDGYDAQEYVIIDDMRKDFMKFHQLLKLLDRYPYKVETKGSTRQFVAREIIITSAIPPEQMYDTREDIKQLIRRIDTVKKFTDWEDEYQKSMYFIRMAFSKNNQLYKLRLK